jgi:cell shape-determining protein MreC
VTEIITSLIGVIGSFMGTLAGIMINSKLTNYRIEQLEKKVDKHNHVIERVYNLEKSEAVFKEDLKVANHRIDDLEGYHK